jgi:hypothetical protein
MFILSWPLGIVSRTSCTRGASDRYDTLHAPKRTLTISFYTSSENEDSSGEYTEYNIIISTQLLVWKRCSLDKNETTVTRDENVTPVLTSVMFTRYPLDTVAYTNTM